MPPTSNAEILTSSQSTYLTAPESICQSLVHAIIKLLPGINVSALFQNPHTHIQPT